MIISGEASDQLAERQRARQALGAASSQADAFRQFRSQVVDGVPPAPAPPLPPGVATGEALASVQRSLESEISTEKAHRQEIARKRSQIEANNRRRTQVIAGLIAVPVVLILFLILLLA